MSNNIEYITDRHGDLLGFIIQSSFQHTGVVFHTKDTDSQQVGTIQHPAGHKVPPHYHPRRQRTINGVQEVIMVRQGKVKVTFYDQLLNFVASYTLGPLDVLVYMNGGHSFEVLEDCDLVEVKQGPYDATKDKILF